MLKSKFSMTTIVTIGYSCLALWLRFGFGFGLGSQSLALSEQQQEANPQNLSLFHSQKKHTRKDTRPKI